MKDNHTLMSKKQTTKTVVNKKLKEAEINIKYKPLILDAILNAVDKEKAKIERVEKLKIKKVKFNIEDLEVILEK